MSKANEKTRVRAIKLHMEGVPAKTIARTLKTNYSNVKYWIGRFKKTHEIALQPYKHSTRIPEQLSSALKEAKSSTRPLTEIARKHGVNYSNLYYTITKRFPKIGKARKRRRARPGNEKH